MKNTIIIQIEEKADGKYDSDVAVRGDITLLAKAVAAGMQREDSFRLIVIEAIENVMAGYRFDITERDELSKKGEPVD